MTIRLAQATDVDAVFSLLETMHDEVGVFSFNKELVRLIVERLTVDLTAGVIGVIEVGEPSVIVATVGLSIMQGAWYTNDRTLYELWSFVQPEHRRSSYAKDLIDFSKKCSDMVKHNGSDLPFFSAVVENDLTSAKCRLYKRQLPQVGAFFLYKSPEESPRV